MKFSYKSNMPAVIRKMEEDAWEVARLSAEAIEDGAKSRVPDAPPIGEGLIDAIHVEKVDNGYAVVAGDSDHFYGHILEGGSVKLPPRPFLVPAAEAEKQHIDEHGRRVFSDLS